MTREEILAVVVSFNGATTLRQTVTALLPQVGGVCIVDNGSEAATAELLGELERLPDVSVVRLAQNQGIAHALNVGARRARETGRPWLLTMDQDSIADAGMVAAFQAALAQDPGMVSLAPVVAGAGPAPGAPVEVVGYAITSGNLVKLSVVEEVGGYEESFFIDSVDFDFCLRVRRAGYRIHRVPGATMQHRLGEGRAVPRLLARFYSEHSPRRRYYISRNILYMAQRHGRHFPLFILKLTLLHLGELVLAGWFDPRPLASYRAALRGAGDFLRRRSGPAPEGIA
ncbi:MAG TPA: glycosyltransferase [Gemmatimonadales bacterium]|nr:glycosyltransferase [Gemmatimonadales bacterium]